MKAHNVLFCANRYVKTLCRFTCSLQSAICPVCVHARESEREGQKKKKRGEAFVHSLDPAACANSGRASRRAVSASVRCCSSAMRASRAARARSDAASTRSTHLRHCAACRAAVAVIVVLVVAFVAEDTGCCVAGGMALCACARKAATAGLCGYVCVRSATSAARAVTAGPVGRRPRAQSASTRERCRSARRRCCATAASSTHAASECEIWARTSGPRRVRRNAATSTNSRS